MTENYKKHFAIGTAAGILGTVGMGIVNYLLRRYWAESLSIPDFGFFYSIYALFMFSLIVIDLGGANYSTIKISKYHPADNKDAVSQLFFSLSLYKIISGMIGAAAVWLLAPWLAVHYFHYEQSSHAIRIMAFFFPVFCLESHLFAVLCAFKSFIFAYGSFLVKFILILIAAMHLHPSITTPPLLFLCGSGGVCVVAAAYIIISRKVTCHPKYWSLSDVWKNLLKGMWLATFNICSQAVLYVDMIFVTVAKGVDEAAVYNIAVPIVQIIYSFLLVIPTVFLPVISTIWAREDSQKTVAAICSSLLYFMLALLWLVLLLIVPFSKQIIILLFSDKYIQAAPLLGFLCAGIVLYTIGFFFFGAWNAGQKNHITSRVMFFAPLVEILLCRIFLPFWGLSGIAAAVFVTHGLIFIAGLTLLKFKIPMMKISLIKMLSICVFGGGLLTASILWINVDRIFSLQSACVLGCMAAYLIFTLPMLLPDIKTTLLLVKK